MAQKSEGFRDGVLLLSRMARRPKGAAPDLPGLLRSLEVDDGRVDENKGRWQRLVRTGRWESRSNARRLVTIQMCCRKNGSRSSGRSLEVFIKGEWRWIYACADWASQAVYDWKWWDGIECLCMAAAAERQQGRVNKYEAARISRDKVVTGLTARTLAPMRSIGFCWSLRPFHFSKERTGAMRDG